ncbi:MAG: Asp-tRNA(Asn)/Glu-tRNA(Gln) amidotransferase subunit GatC [Candidatus Micrarchaeaceae archaeon]
MEDNDFDRLLKTCRMKLEPGEKEKIKEETGQIIAYFDTIRDADCDNYSPSYQPVDVPGRTRPDKVENFHNVGKLLDNSKIYRFYIVGPKV